MSKFQISNNSFSQSHPVHLPKRACDLGSVFLLSINPST